MTLKGIKFLVIAKEPFKKLERINKNLDTARWEKYISEHQDHYTWFEDTKMGINRKMNIDKFPLGHREALLEGLQKRSANSEFNKKKGYYNISLGFNNNYGIINITMTPVKLKKLIERLEHFLDFANYMEGYLLISGTKIINKEFLDKEKEALMKKGEV